MSKKLKPFLFLLLLICLMQGMTVYADSVDVTAWTINSNDDTAQIKLDSSSFKSGKTSLYVSTMQSESGKTTRISQRASGLEPSAQYRLSFWSKAKHIQQFTVVRDLFNITDAKANESGTYDWTQKTVDFTASGTASAFQFTVAYGDGSKGEVWIDDISLYKLSGGEPVGENLILNGGFESDAVPGVVTDAAVTAGDGSLKISWKNPPEDGLKGINIYVDGVFRAMADIEEEEYTIENLENGQEYEISLEAENLNGRKSDKVTIYGLPEKVQRIPDVYADDINDVIIGINEEMEYSVDGGEWTAYTDSQKPDLVGSHLVKVRYTEDGQTEEGRYKVLIFLRESKTPEDSIVFSAHVKLDHVTVKGTAPAAGRVRIVARLSEDPDTIVFIREADTDNDGSFVQEFDMPYTAPAGHYTVKCKADNTVDAAPAEFVYTDNDTLNEFISRLKAASEKDILDILNSVQDRDKLISLGADMAGYEKLNSTNKSNTAKDIYGKRTELSENNLDSITNPRIALGLINQSGNSGEVMDTLYTHQQWLGLSMDSVSFDSVTDSELIAWICERLYGKSFDSVDALSAFYQKQCAFYILNNESYVNMTTVMNKYKNELGIGVSAVYSEYLRLTSDDKETVNRRVKLANVAYDTENALIAAISEAMSRKTNNSNDSNAVKGGGAAVLGGNSASGSAVRNTPSPSPTEAPVQSVDTKIFNDLGSVPWAEYEINSLAQRGIVSGFGDGVFEPDGFVTREQLAVMAANAFGISSDQRDDTPFIDVSEDRWSYPQIKAMKLGGFIQGYDDGTFMPENNISREDMVVILYRILTQLSELPPKIRDNADFTDIEEISGYAIDGVREMYCMGFVNGVGDMEFAPKGTATRAMAAKVIYDILDSTDNEEYGNEDGAAERQSTVVQTAQKTVNNESLQNDIAMLRTFGILDGGIGSLDSRMKKGDYFKIICNMLNLNSIEELISTGILVGTDGADIGEDENIGYTQAVSVLVGAIGYSKMAEQAGGYPSGYMRIASERGITKGVSSREDIIKSELVTLILNACDTEILQLTGTGGSGNTYSTVDDETILAYYHDIYRHRGIVSEAGDICINRESSGSTDGVVIGGTYMKAGSVDAELYLGMEVYGYYRQRNENDDPELIYVKPTSKNSAITVQADDIVEEKTTKGQLVYIPDGTGSEKRLKISSVADMVYNRRGYLNYEAEDFMPKVGKVRLIDNDGDGVYDCIIVTDYRTILVDRVSAASEEIFSQYGGSVDLSAISDYSIYDTTGAEINLSDIANGNVIFVEMPKKGDYAVITVCADTVTGIPSATNSDDKTLVIDDTEYKINSHAYDYYETESKDIMEIGKRRIYYLDPDGRIAGYKVSSGDEQMYGYLYNRYMDDGDNNMFMVILDENGKWNTYTVADKIKINDETVKANANNIAMLPERQVVRFRLDDDSKVRRIETAQVISDGDDTEYFNKISLTKTYRSPNASFNSEFYLDGNMIIFNIPTGTDEAGYKYADDREYYSVTGNEFEDGQNYTVTLYDVDKNNRASVVSYEKSGSDKTLGKTVFLVDKLSIVAKDNDTVQSVSGIVVGQELSVTAKDSELFDGLKRGDLIRFHINDDGRVDAVGIVQKADDEWVDEEVLTNNLSSSTPAILKGTIVHVDSEEGYIKIQGTDGTRALKVNNARFSIYDKNDKKVMAAESADIQIGDFAVVLASSSDVKSVTVYR